VSELSQIASTGPSAAFFDLDRTLIAGASAFVVGLAAWRADLLPAHQLAADGIRALTFRLGATSDGATDRARDRMLAGVTGIRQDDLVALNEDVVPRLLAKVRPEARRLLELHRHAGRNTYIVSASPEELVVPLAAALGMSGGIGTIAEVVDGVYTGALSGPFCYGAGKVQAIGELARWEGLDLAQCYAYSDAASDLPMLEAVGHPVAVNPDGRLERVAHQRGWPIVIFRRRSKAVIRRTTAAVGTVGVASAAFAGGLQVGRTRRAR
jgi:HAD superfamily hydrolase (TIGR01490 family)